MRERGLRAIASLCEQADAKADAVLLDSYNTARKKGGRALRHNRL